MKPKSKEMDMTLRKPVLIASLAAALGLGAVCTQASAADPALGALVGGGIGAVIGHNVGHGGGATAAGAVVGALVGSSVAASSNYYGQPYYDSGYYAPPPAAYAPPPAYAYSEPVYAPPVYSTYYAPAPVYAGPSIVIGSGWGHHYYGHHVYRHWDGHRHH
jgi:hypothetical protein